MPTCLVVTFWLSPLLLMFKTFFSPNWSATVTLWPPFTLMVALLSFVVAAILVFTTWFNVVLFAVPVTVIFSAVAHTVLVDFGGMAVTNNYCTCNAVFAALGDGGVVELTILFSISTVAIPNLIDGCNVVRLGLYAGCGVCSACLGYVEYVANGECVALLRLTRAGWWWWKMKLRFVMGIPFGFVECRLGYLLSLC